MKNSFDSPFGVSMSGASLGFVGLTGNKEESYLRLGGLGVSVSVLETDLSLELCSFTAEGCSCVGAKEKFLQGYLNTILKPSD